MWRQTLDRGQGGSRHSITVHQTVVALSLDRPPAGRRKTAQAASDPDQLRFAILAGHDREERASWQDGQGGRLERFVQEIAVEVRHLRRDKLPRKLRPRF
jgi:hypothetical protein